MKIFSSNQVRIKKCFFYLILQVLDQNIETYSFDWDEDVLSETAIFAPYDPLTPIQAANFLSAESSLVLY